MKKINILVLVVFMVSVFSVDIGAAPVSCPTSVKEMKGKDYIYKDANMTLSASAAAEADLMRERKLDELEGEIESSFYTVKLILAIDRVDVYTVLGEAVDTEYNAQVSGADVRYQLEDKFTWGVGVAGLIYEWKKWGMKIFGDASYRTISNMDYDSFTLEGIQYTQERLKEETKDDAKWEEWQVALAVARKFEYITPYAGIKYSDIDASANVSLFNVSYDTKTLNGGEDIGVFVGCSIMPIENISLDLEARFIDESAYTVALVGTF